MIVTDRGLCKATIAFKEGGKINVLELVVSPEGVLMKCVDKGLYHISEDMKTVVTLDSETQHVKSVDNFTTDVFPIKEKDEDGGAIVFVESDLESFLTWIKLNHRTLYWNKSELCEMSKVYNPSRLMCLAQRAVLFNLSLSNSEK
ncbi:hypothetical protein [Vibrio phage Va2]|nr:hypothetical protein [Vibrio phage Va2]